MKNKIYFLFITAIICSIIIGCDGDFNEINRDPNNPTSINADRVLANLLFNTANTQYAAFPSLDQGAGWAQQVAKVQYNDEMRYIPREGTIQFVWNDFYRATSSDANQMIIIGTELNQKASVAVGKIMKAYGVLMLTDLYGDIPFTEAFDPKNIVPVYDTQEVVYDGCLKLLQEAIEILDNPKELKLPATSDLLYDGDLVKWQKFAGSLKFRALMRISGKKDVSAQLQELINKKHLFSSKNQEAKFKYLGSEPNANPIFETIVVGNRGEYKINSYFVDLLQSFNDPRLPVFAQPNNAGIIRGKPSGFINLPSAEYGYTNVSALGKKYLEPEQPAYLLSFSELNFLIAEAAKKGFISGGDQLAETYYKLGLDTSFLENGLTQKDADVYGAQTEVAYSSENALARIGIQKYIALFGQGMEVWIEWRRTGIPNNLKPAVASNLGSIPVRFTYPVIEQSLNANEYRKAVSRQGEDKLTTPVWWNK